MFLAMVISDGAQSKSHSKKEIILENLILDISKNNKTAFEEFYRLTDSSVYGYALSILKRPHEAEDVMHDAYIKIFEVSNRYQPMGKPMAWILTIVRNIALTKLRLKSETNITLEDKVLLDPYDFTDSSIDKIILDKMLRYLTDEECQIVVLHSTTGLKFTEIAEFLGIPLSTVISKYHRSLLKLKKLIKEEV